MVAQILNGIVINEILADPRDANGAGFDTDGNGTIAEREEFIELHNTTGSAVDIGNWTLSDNAGLQHTFAPDAVIAPFGKFTVYTNYDNTPLPDDSVNLGTSSFLNNGGDRIILSNGTETITAGYNGTASDENFGSDTDGESLQRTPDGADVFASAAPTPGAPNPECFLTGTRILTESGYKLVEELAIGDKVETAEGNLVDVKWIGYQTIDPTALTLPLRGNPVLVKAGALGNNLPARDLYISPDHSLFIDGLLINAGALVNGISILQTQPTETFVYHSVELENHALLTVEGTHAESYMPHHEDRANYDNGSEYEELYPHGSNLMLWPMDYPRISSKTQVPSFVSQKLLNIAQQLEGILVSA